MRRKLLIPALLIPLLITSAEIKHPNILLIQTDEHSLKTLSCYRNIIPQDLKEIWGKEAISETPNIDKIAKKGIIFTNCYATTPVSSPSRASMLTGLYPQKNDVVGNDISLNSNVETLADILRENGYSTGYFGKLHLDGNEKPGWKPSRDYGFSNNDYMYNRGHNKYILDINSKPSFPDKNSNNYPDSLFTTDVLTERAISFIRKESKKPYFCYVSFPDPHGPNYVRPPYDKMYDHLNFQMPLSASKDQTNLPMWNKGNAKMEDMSKYFGMIKCIDDNIGKILNLVDNTNPENTIIIFTSDHGDLCGEHGLINKGVPMDGSAKVPFIISYPGTLKKNYKEDQIISLIDLTPTLLSLINIKTNRSFDGRNLKSLFLDGDIDPTEDDAIYMRGAFTKAPNKKSAWISVVCDGYKLTLSENKEDEPWMVNLNTDPNELINIFNQKEYLSVKEKLKQKLKSYCIKHNEPRYNNKKIKYELFKSDK